MSRVPTNQGAVFDYIAGENIIFEGTNPILSTLIVHQYVRIPKTNYNRE